MVPHLTVSLPSRHKNKNSVADVVCPVPDSTCVLNVLLGEDGEDREEGRV